MSNPNELSDTPRTDAAIAALEAELGDGPPCISSAAIDVAVRINLANIARQIERELRAALIDAEAYLEELDNNDVVSGHNYWGLTPLLERIKAALASSSGHVNSASPTSQDNPSSGGVEWIPCSERLPKDGSVLVYSKYDIQDVMTSSALWSQLNYNAHSPWTHWMPLPTSPKN